MVVGWEEHIKLRLALMVLLPHFYAMLVKLKLSQVTAIGAGQSVASP